MRYGEGTSHPWPCVVIFSMLLFTARPNSEVTHSFSFSITSWVIVQKMHANICTRPRTRTNLKILEILSMDHQCSLKRHQMDHHQSIIPSTVSCTLTFNDWRSHHEPILILDVYTRGPRHLGRIIPGFLMQSRRCLSLFPSRSLNINSTKLG
jgi:hypothetical protein